MRFFLENIKQRIWRVLPSKVQLTIITHTSVQCHSRQGDTHDRRLSIIPVPQLPPIEWWKETPFFPFSVSASWDTFFWRGLIVFWPLCMHSKPWHHQCHRSQIVFMAIRRLRKYDFWMMERDRPFYMWAKIIPQAFLNTELQLKF